MNGIIVLLADKLGNPLPAPEPEYRFRCHRCVHRKGKEDRTGHLYVNPTKQRFCCHRCGYGGKLSSLLASLGLSYENQEPVRNWAATMGTLLGKNDHIEDAYDNTLELEYPCPVLHPSLCPAHAVYLAAPKPAGRGLTLEQVNYYRIMSGTDKYRNRIFIPTLHEGSVVFWVARTVCGEEPKYLNPKGVSKKHYLFGLDQARAHRTVIITEGVFSAIAAGPNAVATFGKSVSAEQKSLLLDSAFDTYFVALDGDARKESIDLCAWLASHGLDSRIVDIPDGHDPDSYDIKSAINSAKPFDKLSASCYTLK